MAVLRSNSNGISTGSKEVCFDFYKLGIELQEFCGNSETDCMKVNVAKQSKVNLNRDCVFFRSFEAKDYSKQWKRWRCVNRT